MAGYESKMSLLSREQIVFADFPLQNIGIYNCKGEGKYMQIDHLFITPEVRARLMVAVTPDRSKFMDLQPINLEHKV